jgi:hypothetical protein
MEHEVNNHHHGHKDKGEPSCPPPKDDPRLPTVPQPDPPFQPATSGVPPWRQDRPPPGDPGEIPWFHDNVTKIVREGPTFGPRKDEFLPYLVVRAASGDRGARPYTGVFWESPDIFVAPDQEASMAPLMPESLGVVAKASVPNTVYAHVWNLGKAPAYRVRVEFYWVNPALDISRANANFIGAAWVDLANRFTHYPNWVEVNTSYGRWISRGSHVIVPCPETWIPQFENNGHECLVVRAFEPLLDPVGPTQFLPAADRHVGQRNIAVVQPSSPAAIDLVLDLGQPEFPPDGEVNVVVEGPATMEWLQLFAGNRNPGYRVPKTHVLTRLQPAPPRPPPHIPDCDFLQLGFQARIADLQPREAQVIRLQQRVGGNVVGGYSVVLIRP